MAQQHDTEEAEQRGGDRVRLRILEKQMQTAADKLEKVCAEVSTVLAELRVRNGQTCPAPGRCIELGVELKTVVLRVDAIEKTMSWAKGAAWGLGGLGVANLLGLAANFFKS